MRIALTPLLLAASLNAQSGGFGTPQLAVIFRAGTGTLHAVSGVAHANRTGPAAAGVPKLVRAVVAHNGGFALGVSDSGKVLLVRLENGGVSDTLEFSELDSPRSISLSPRSESAAIRNGDSVTVMTNLRGVVERRSLPAALADDAGNLAVSDDGTLVAFASPARGMLYVVNTRTGAMQEIRGADVSAIQFVALSSDLLVADRSHYYVIREGVPVTLPAAEGNAAPVAVASGSDGRSYFLADASGRIQRVDSLTLSSAVFDCGCTVQRLQPGNGAARFEIGESEGRRIYLDWSDSPVLFSIQEAQQ